MRIPSTILRLSIVVAFVGALLAGCADGGSPTAPSTPPVTGAAATDPAVGSSQPVPGGDGVPGTPRGEDAVLGGNSFSTMDYGRWLIRVQDTAIIQDLLDQYGFLLGELAADLHLFTVIIPALPPEFLSDPRIVAIQPDEPTALSMPQEMLMGFNEGGWDEGAYPAQDALSGLHLARVHTMARGKGITVAVLDTGVDLLHPHLAGRIVDQPSPDLPPPMEIANHLDDDGDGLVDEAFGHGTHVAGTIATVAPDAKILPLKVMNDDGVGTSMDLAIGLSYALQAGAQVVNLSLALSDTSAVIAGLLQDLEDAGVEVVAAAGNTGAGVLFPASHPTVVSAAAVTTTGELATFSARGTVDLGAPGVQVVSSYPGGGTAMASGTSMAAAVVSGTVALLRGQSKVGPVVPWMPPLAASAVDVQPAGGIIYGEVAPLAALKLSLERRGIPWLQESTLGTR